MRKSIILIVSALALAFSSCTENEKVLNSTTGQYYAIQPHSWDEDWQPLFNQ